MAPNGNFTPGEVMALLEELKSEFRYVTEVVAPLPNRLEAVEKRLSAVEERLTKVEDGMRVGFPAVNVRLSALEAKVG